MRGHGRDLPTPPREPVQYRERVKGRVMKQNNEEFLVTELKTISREITDTQHGKPTVRTVFGDPVNV